MDCNKLITNINSTCADPFRIYEPVGWVGSYSGVINQVRDGAKVTFDSTTGFFPVYDRSRKPFNGSTVKSVENEFYTTFTELVQFPMLLNDPYNAAALNVLKKDKAVIILEQVSGGIDYSSKYQVFGLDGGLTLLSAPNDDAADVAWLIQMQREKNPSNVKFLFDTDKDGTIAKIGQLTSEHITGLTIGDGSVTPRKVYLKVDSDKTCYVVLPNNTILTSTAGVIDTTWTGAAGDVTLVVPKDTALFSISKSGEYGAQFIGSFEIKSSVQSINTDAVVYLSGLISKTATNIKAYNCALTISSVKSILDNAYTLYLAGQLTGLIDLSGGTNAELDPADMSAVHPNSYGTLIDDMTTVGWTILFT